MSSIGLPCLESSLPLLLVSPRTAYSVRAAQLGRQRFCVVQADNALDIFLMRHTIRFTIAVLNDEIGTPFLCAAAESVRQQWPYARILILGRVPAPMKDQLYDEVAVHSVDEDTLWATIDKLTEDPWKKVNPSMYAYLRGGTSAVSSVRELLESDPTKCRAGTPQGVYARDLPSTQPRSQRRG